MMMANEKSGKTMRTLTTNQRTVEDWINNHEEQGKFLNQLGLVSDEELAAGIDADEQIRLKIEADPAEADKIVRAESEEV
jgi:hypothetical protein